MADQVLIEIIGDPSGLEPLKLGLKAVGGWSETMEKEFTSANAKFQSAATNSAGAVRGLGQAVKEMPMAAAAGAMKEATVNLQQHVTAAKAVAGSYNELKSRAHELDQEFKNTGSKSARLEFLAIRAEMKEVELQNRTLVKSMATSAGQFGLLAGATSGLFGAMAAGQEIMAMFNDGTEEGAENAKKAAKAQQLLVIVMGLAEVARAKHEISELRVLALTKLTAVQERLGITTKAQLTAATVASATAKEADAVATAEQATAEVGANVATKAKLTTQTIENALTSESIVIKYAAAAAQWALNAAMSPIGLAVIAVAALGAAYELLKKHTVDEKDAQEALNKSMEAYNNMVELRIGRLTVGHEREMGFIDQEIAQRKAAGGSEAELMALEEKKHEKKKEFLLEYEGKQSDQFKHILGHYREFYDETEEMAQEAAKKRLDAARMYRDPDSDKGEARKMQVETEKMEAAVKVRREGLDKVNEYSKQIQENNTERLAAQEAKDKKAIDDHLHNLKAMYDVQVELADKGSRAELAAKKRAIDQATNNTIAGNPNLTAQEKQLAWVQAENQKEDLDNAYKAAQINRDKELLNIQLSFIEADSPKRLEILNKLVEDERRLKVDAANNDWAIISAINKEAEEKAAKNTLQIAHETEVKRLQIEQMRNATAHADAVPGGFIELEGKQQEVELKRQMDIQSANFSIKNETEKQARIAQIEAEATAKQKALIEKNQASELDEDLKTLELLKRQADLDRKKGRDGQPDEAEALKGDIELQRNKLTVLREGFDESRDLESQHAADILSVKEKLAADEAALQKKQADNELATRKQVADLVQQYGQQVSDGIFANAEANRANDLAASLNTIKAEGDAELLNSTLTAQQRQAIQRKVRAEEANEKLKAWKADQKAKEEQAIINGLLAFTTTLAGGVFPFSLIPASIALATAGVEAGLIASRPAPKFATGTPGSMVAPAGFKWVGEQGPELINTPGGEKIITHPDSMALMAKYQIPNVNLAPLLQGTGVTVAAGQPIDYDRLGKVIAGNIPSHANNHIHIDETGFSKFVVKGGNKTTVQNTRIDH